MHLFCVRSSLGELARQRLARWQLSRRAANTPPVFLHVETDRVCGKSVGVVLEVGVALALSAAMFQRPITAVRITSSLSVLVYVSSPELDVLLPNLHRFSQTDRLQDLRFDLWARQEPQSWIGTFLKEVLNGESHFSSEESSSSQTVVHEVLLSGDECHLCVPWFLVSGPCVCVCVQSWVWSHDPDLMWADKLPGLVSPECWNVSRKLVSEMQHG